MSRPHSLDDLWHAVEPGPSVFDPARVSGLPEGARRYLAHAIAAGTPLASAVRLRMHGEIKLKGWCPFKAEQVIAWHRGMIWRATVRMSGIPIRGGDVFLDGHGAMRWKLFGLLPVVSADGPDISRSAAGRVNIESIWLPPALLSEQVAWSGNGPRLQAGFRAHGQDARITYTIRPDGGLASVSMPRWGNPDGGEFREISCGGFVEAEGTFAGYTIPTKLRVGWHFTDNGFENDGEFFRVTIDDALFR